MLGNLRRRLKGDIGVAEDLLTVCREIEQMDFHLAHETNRLIRAESVKFAHEGERALLLNKRSLLFDAPYDFDAYMLYIEYERDVDKQFYAPRRRVLRPAVEQIQRLIDDEIDLLCLSLPPGVGKTTLAIFFLSMLMGMEPDKANLASAHSDKLTRSIYDGVLQILTEDEYLWSDVFQPLGKLATNAKDNTINVGKPKRFKSLTCRSIDGTLTGATRAMGVLYSDDLVSGIEEALSKPRLDTLWNKYTNDLKSRKMKGCKELHVATRWSVHDPIGRIEDLHDGSDRAVFISIPALDEDGVSNFDYPYGVGFDTDFYLDMKNTLDDLSWRCLYQQEPLEREGLLYPDDTLTKYYELPPEDPDAVVAICDTAEGGGDDTFMPVAYLYGDEVYIADCVCDDGLPIVTVPLCATMLVKHRVKQARFESNAAGSGFADKVHEEVSRLGGGTHITKKRTISNKMTRMIVNSGFVMENFRFLSKEMYDVQSPYAKMMKLLTGFTVRGKAKHDDVPDGMAQLSEYIQSLRGNEVEVFRRPF